MRLVSLMPAQRRSDLASRRGLRDRCGKGSGSIFYSNQDKLHCALPGSVVFHSSTSVVTTCEAVRRR